MRTSTLLPWLGAIISEAVSGFFHGAIVGGGVGGAAADDLPHLAHVAVIGGMIGAVKDIGLYVNANPLPNIFAQPTIAPVAGPVAPPTVSDQSKTLVSPSNP